MIALKDRWTGASLSGVVAIQENNGDITSLAVNGTKLFSDAEWPITVSVHVLGYISKTIVATNANLLVFPMEKLDGMEGTVLAYALIQPYEQIGGAPDPSHWRVTAIATNNWDEWDESYGGPLKLPFVVAHGNPYRSLGIVAFLQRLTVVSGIGSTGQPASEDPLIGYFYKDLAWGPPGAITGWVFQMAEEDDVPFTHSEGTWTIDPGVWADEQIARIALLGGGSKIDGWQFVPYGLLTKATVLETKATVLEGDPGTDTYNFDAYDPDVGADRDVIEARIRYSSGASETMYIDWDPSDGSTLPDIDFGVPPVFDEATCCAPEYLLTGSWTNAPAEGLLKVRILSPTGATTWEIWLDSDSTGFPEDGLPVHVLLPVGPPSNTGLDLTRVECAGIDIDGYDYDTIWGSVTTFITSAPIAINDTFSVVP
jgi:hypothetical protein